jgi:signal transduction histidine kinase
MPKAVARPTPTAIWAWSSGWWATPLPDSLRDLAARLGEEHDAVVDVAVREGLPPIAEFVAGNLLLVAQEALLNALRHGEAAAVAVRLGPTQDGGLGGPHAVELTIRDDGRGFDPANRPGTRQGHFGIEGMSERVERLGGTIRIESRPGAGTTVVVRVPAIAATPDGLASATPYEGPGTATASTASMSIESVP